MFQMGIYFKGKKSFYKWKSSNKEEKNFTICYHSSVILLTNSSIYFFMFPSVILQIIKQEQRVPFQRTQLWLWWYKKMLWTWCKKWKIFASFFTLWLLKRFIFAFEAIKEKRIQLLNFARPNSFVEIRLGFKNSNSIPQRLHVISKIW